MKKIVADTEEFVIINKPASMPTHNGGNYQLNSALEITKQLLKNKTEKLSTVHRLDRVVSGILIFSKSSSFSKYFQSLLNENEVKKIYITRIYGKFPRLVYFKHYFSFLIVD